jgi:hypothetical protein
MKRNTVRNGRMLSRKSLDDCVRNADGRVCYASLRDVPM